MTIDQETKCSTGPSELFANVAQCPRKPYEYIFGDPYCKECADTLRDLHVKMTAATTTGRTRLGKTKI